ncbi:hypothetical protein VP01_75g3 [Puccinia sorghi]|uniref:Inositol-pentakisphosphate 2-kinase n=1 Tax=Puccinia sorghi TaxID=27349 RepID=A0A0L6UC09_9BASI|nr:hypothetical protein VP01_75g3 [Puccinia sorghi]
METDPTADWQYIAEGAANLILAYNPQGKRTEALNGKCLRLSKRTQGTTTTHNEISSYRFHSQVLSQIIHQELLLTFQPVSLNQEWLKELANHFQATRPASKRCLSQIDPTATHAIIMDNLACQPDGDNQQMLSIEIKPKWASFPCAPNRLDPALREIKTQFCRTCVFRAVRSLGPSSSATHHDPQSEKPQEACQALNPYYTSPNRFCALQLFNTAHPAHLRRALAHLFAEWQYAPASHPPATSDPALGPKDDTTVKPTLAHNNLKIFCQGILIDPSSVQVDPEMIEALAVALERSGVLVRLAELQRRLDPLDIEGVFEELGDWAEAEVEEPASLEELVAVLPLLSEQVTPAGFADSFRRLSGRTKAVLYALSMSFKDCSIFVRIPRRPQLPTSRLSPAPLPHNSSVKLIDLDFKPLARLHKYLRTNRHTFLQFKNLLLSSPDSPHTPCVQLATSLPLD